MERSLAGSVVSLKKMDSKRFWTRKRSFPSKFEGSRAPPMSLVEKALTPKSVESVVVDGEALESLRSFHELCARSSLSGGPTYCTPRQMRYFTDVPDLLHILEQRLQHRLDLHLHIRTRSWIIAPRPFLTHRMNLQSSWRSQS